MQREPQTLGPGSVPRSRRRKLLVRSVLALTAAFLLARFASLQADFPAYLTASDAPLTDEGWYSNSAIRHYLTGEWYLPGDLNEAIIQPTFHVIQALNFRLLGMSLTTSRLPAAVLSCALVLVCFALLRLRAGLDAALLAALLLAVDSHLFAYSRIALVELPLLFFVMASALLLFDRSARLSWRHGLGAGILLAIGCLTKPTAAFTLPALLVLAAIRSKQTGRWAILPAFVTGAATPLALVYTFAFLRFPDDLRVYGRGLEVYLQPVADNAVKNGVQTLAELFRTDPPLMVAVFLSGLLCLATPRLLIRNHLLGFLVTVFGLYLLILIGIENHPTRYFLPAIALAPAIVATSASQMLQLGRRTTASILIILICASVVLNGFQSARYLLTAETTYLKACEELAQDVIRTGSEPLLMGNMATQMSIVTGIPGISGDTESTDPAWLRDKYRPTHYVSRETVSREFLDSTQAQGQDLALIATYDVFGGEAARTIHLYRFVPSQSGSDYSSEISRALLTLAALPPP